MRRPQLRSTYLLQILLHYVISLRQSSDIANNYSFLRPTLALSSGPCESRNRRQAHGLSLPSPATVMEHRALHCHIWSTTPYTDGALPGNQAITVLSTDSSSSSEQFSLGPALSYRARRILYHKCGQSLSIAKA